MFNNDFSIESIEQTFNDNVDFGKTVSFTIPRSGDFIRQTYLTVDLPKIIHKPLSLFELCSLAVTEEELLLLPECIREDAQKIRNENDKVEIEWTRNLGNKIHFDWNEWLYNEEDEEDFDPFTYDFDNFGAAGAA